MNKFARSLWKCLRSSIIHLLVSMSSSLYNFICDARRRDSRANFLFVWVLFWSEFIFSSVSLLNSLAIWFRCSFSLFEDCRQRQQCARRKMPQTYFINWFSIVKRKNTASTKWCSIKRFEFSLLCFMFI